MADNRDIRRTVSVNREFEFILEPEAVGGFHVSCPRLRGCHSYGTTVEEALDNMADAVQEYLDLLFDDVLENGGVLLIRDEHVLADGRVPERLLAAMLTDSGLSEEEFLEHLAEMVEEAGDDDDDDDEEWRKAKGSRG